MASSWLADLVLAAHLAFIVFVVTGGLLALRWPRAVFVHLPAALWGAYVEMSGSICPLTPLENALRARAGQAGYAGGFIEHYVGTIVYPPGLSAQVQWMLACAVIACNVAAYTFVWRRRRARGLC